MQNLYPLKFYPIPQERIWGGNKLRDVLNKPFSSQKIGESWEISAVEGNISVVANGVWKDKSFDSLITDFPLEILGEKVVSRYGKTFPLLIKFIDAQKDLSVQLHPNDDLAMKRHNSLGKEEMWYIMDAEKGSRLMFGFDRKLDRDSYTEYLEKNALEDVLHYEKVSKGDFFQIPTGRVHAIGAGILLAEIQQSSDITYRLYDWNRVDEFGNARTLHTDLALEAIDFTIPDTFKSEYENRLDENVRLGQNAYFIVNLCQLSQAKVFTHEKEESFVIYICVEGTAMIDTETITMGETVLIPAGLKEYTITPQTPQVKLLQVFP